MVRILYCTFFAGAVMAPAAPLSDALTADEQQQVLRMLRQQFAMPEAVDFAALNRAALRALLDEHRAAMELLPEDRTTPAALPMLAVMLSDRIAWMRHGPADAAGLTAIRDRLTKLATGPAESLILDLRGPSPDTDPETAAALASCFLPEGTAVFTVKDPVLTSGPPVWTKEVIALIDPETSNADEILAIALKARGRALLAGSRTRGRTARFAALRLPRAGQPALIFRCAVQKVVFPDHPDPFGSGVEPDLGFPFDPAEKEKLRLAHLDEASLRAAITGPVRPRLNEAALVAGTNPELDGLSTPPPVRPPVDRPLQAAVDVILTRHALAPPHAEVRRAEQK